VRRERPCTMRDVPEAGEIRELPQGISRHAGSTNTGTSARKLHHSDGQHGARPSVGDPADNIPHCSIVLRE
jgi:hypothetical protein